MTTGNPWTLEDFVRESNRIERIYRDPTDREIEAHQAFLALRSATVEDLQGFVSAVQPDAVLRDRFGLDVFVGNHVPPSGGPHIKRMLEGLLENIDDAYDQHVEYETIHPFTDGNGRSGRVLWLWRMGGIEEVSLGFLHTFYYQTLSHSGGRGDTRVSAGRGRSRRVQ